MRRRTFLQASLGAIVAASLPSEIRAAEGKPMTLIADAPPPTSPLALWYRSPAQDWLEALPLGNGRLAAMVYGGVEAERLQLNEGTVWAGGPYTPANPAGSGRPAGNPAARLRGQVVGSAGADRCQVHGHPAA